MTTHINFRSARSPISVIIMNAIVLSVCLAIVIAGCGLKSDRPMVDSANQELREIRSPDILFVPTPQEVVDKMLELAEVTKDDLIYDLGCGDGRIVVTAAKKYGCRGIGYDIDPERILESLENVRNNNVQKLVRIEQKDIFTLDLSDASVISLYLLASLNVKLIPQLEKLKPGTRIVSHDFAMQGIVTPDTTITVNSSGYGSHTVHLWIAPLKRNDMKY
ncbi:SAM-dependent methyltransferase [Candidatus Latescibacterota bacterium]